MRTEQIKIYKFNELSEQAQQNAIDNWRSNDVCFDGDEIVDTLKAFADQFNITLGSWELGGRGAHINYSVQCFCDSWVCDSWDGADECTVKGLRLWKYLINNTYHMVKNQFYDGSGPMYVDIRETDCPLTGVCFDHDILAPILEFLKNPLSFDGNYHELIGECMDAILSTYETALEDWYSEDRISEDIQNQDCEFLENGDIH